LSLFHCFYNYALANEVLNLFRVDIMPPTAEEYSLLILEPSFPFPFPFRVTALALSDPRDESPPTHLYGHSRRSMDQLLRRQQTLLSTWVGAL
jgi:hypothetical protein